MPEQQHNQPHPHRIVKVNELQTHKYINNKISTTKYNILTFIPRFLYEQFRKYANVYFLSIALIQQIPDVSPTGRFTTLVPFCIILSVSGFKEIIEDIKRKRSDDKTNGKKSEVMRNGVWMVQTWSQMHVGDVIKVHNGESFPADLVLLSSSEPNGICYIETANLDGETNLKVRQSSTRTNKLRTDEQFKISTLSIECEHPNKLLYEFVGNLKLGDNKQVPLGPDQILLRGATLKNTKLIYETQFQPCQNTTRIPPAPAVPGVIVYSGYETKLMLNSSKVPLKRSTVDKVVNRQVLMLFCVLLMLAWASTVGAFFYKDVLEQQHWYLAFKDSKQPNNLLMNMLTFIVLYNNLIPISLQVTMEMVKFTQALFIGWDKEMYYPVTNTPAAARTSNLNEELGQVKYVFSDKTGTLTSNIMTLRYISVNGVIFGKDFEETEQPTANDDVQEESILQSNLPITSLFSSPGPDKIPSTIVAASPDKTEEAKQPATVPRKMLTSLLDDILTMCAICHTVVPEEGPNNEINYQAASPDERALVLGAIKTNYIFKRRTPETVTITVRSVERTYRLLNVIEFTSDRKRMTIVVEEPGGRIRVFVKGADTMIMERLSPASHSAASVLNEHVYYFSTLGLRTLCFAHTVLTKTQYNTWKEQFQAASTSIQNREKKIADVAEIIEKNLTLIGATAIEDKLQDGVPECIFSLLKANIKVWVLTGDKQETAINIAMSCKLISRNSNIIRFNETTMEGTVNKIANMTEMIESDTEGLIALVIDGKSLTFALKDSCKRDFLLAAVKCKAVVCCRVSPSQKAEIVRMVKEGCNAITLAIGDGANDVGMIQEAHVGVGISGMEGLQAVCASDYAIAQFCYLKRLLLVHGNWNYNRVTKLILYCFYKNICFYFCEFWYALVSAFSGQVIFERWTIGLFNVLFTAAPPLAIGLFDQVERADVLMTMPQLYVIPQSSVLFNVKVFWMWCLNAVYVSMIVFWIPCLAMKHDAIFYDGKVGSYLFTGNVIYTIVIVTVCLKAFIECTVWNAMVHFLIHGSIFMWFLFFPLYSRIWPSVDVADEMVGMDYQVLTSMIFWLLLLIVPFTALLRDILAKILGKLPIVKNFRDSRQVQSLKTVKSTSQRKFSLFKKNDPKHDEHETIKMVRNNKAVPV